MYFDAKAITQLILDPQAAATAAPAIDALPWQCHYSAGSCHQRIKLGHPSKVDIDEGK